ncbi:hypothetical protein [Streptomyces sp. Isolate_45]|uniref:hypothetical protein n=1 Tax=Streptomyces sp. Isolate_45 TaxID=2950111 RepID=UPI002481E626|nr:hypothetical protein [Streptomyces sp. Isolate_45]MDA5279472.1 hypothetical protein [Streptomyces sp. Isolate_45]
MHQVLSVATATTDLEVRTAQTDGEGISMPKVPDGYVSVRSYIRRKPGPRKAKGLSIWAIAGLCAVVWLWGQVFGFGDSSAEQQPAPKPAVSAPAGGQ